jgi:hypothetical protein
LKETGKFLKKSVYRAGLRRRRLIIGIDPTMDLLLALTA